MASTSFAGGAVQSKEEAGVAPHFAEPGLPSSDIPVSAPTAPIPASLADNTKSDATTTQGTASDGKGTAESNKDEVKSTGAVWTFVKVHICSQFAWVLPVVTDWSKLKPVLRSSLAAWLCMLCLVISPVEIALGSASFLILIGIFIAPCEVPIAAVVEREFFILLLTTVGWAYSNLAVFFAHLARKNKVPKEMVSQELIYTGGYIEAGPTSICAAFLGIGVGAALYLKVKFGPSPFLFAAILGCISMDIILIYAPLYPFPFYLLGQAVVVPLALKSGIAIFVSCVFYPKSINSAFVDSLLTVLKPLGNSSRVLLDLTNHSPTEIDFNFDKVHKQISQAEGGVAALRGSARLLTREISFSLASGEDLKSLVQLFVTMLAPADGISYYFSSIKADIQGMEIHIHPQASKFNTPLPTRPGTPTQSLPSTPTIEEVPTKSQTDDVAVTSSTQFVRPRMRSQHLAPEGGPRSDSPASSVRRNSHELRHRMNNALHHWHWRHPHQDTVEVGLWESLRYTAIEGHLHSRKNDRFIELGFQLIFQISQDLLKQQVEAVDSVQDWLSQLNSQRISQLRKKIFFSSTEQIWPTTSSSSSSSAETMEKGKTPKSVQQSIDDLKRALIQFKIDKKIVLEPFRYSVDQMDLKADVQGGERERIPHRYLFQCFTFCYFQAQYTNRLIRFLEEIREIEKKRTHWRFWFPKLPKLSIIDAWKEESGEGIPEDHDEDPDQIPGMASSLGKTKARDPEALETGDGLGILQMFGLKVSLFFDQLFKGISLFMIKAGILTVLVALPSYLKSSAGWAYHNKAIWVVIMSQLSIARHRGEVLFSLASRLIATLLGALIGMVIWYIASGDGRGNPYAMQVVVAFGFTIAMMIRFHLPVPPLTKIIITVTIALVVGYSWNDSHNPTYGSPGVGWTITWRRFTEVVIGTAAAYVIAILPPTSSMRRYFRLSHATALGELGGMYCQVITMAASPKTMETKFAINHLIAIRAKIRRLMMLKASISYEWSFRGQWPIKRYEELEEVELQLSKLLTHAVTICENLGPKYSRALLRRTHFLDSIFLADCIAILTMCTTSLRTGTPLPQIVPVLIDRYMSTKPGFQFHHNNNGNHEDHKYGVGRESLDEEDFTEDCLPKVVTFETLCKEEYQTFAVGVSVFYGIVLRIDRLCLAVKALVGETYSVPTDMHLNNYQH